MFRALRHNENAPRPITNARPEESIGREKYRKKNTRKLMSRLRNAHQTGSVFLAAAYESRFRDSCLSACYAEYLEQAGGRIVTGTQ